MKQPILIVFLFITTFSLAQKTTAKEAWLKKWENSKNYLIEIAEAMPEAAYNFKPTERQMSFKEQLVHIKSNMDWLSNTYFTDVEFKREKTELPATKAETIALITEGFNNASLLIAATPEERLLKTVDFFAGPKSRLQIINLLHDHVTHHRGQLIVYLNLNEIEPPSYVGW
ncbi:MAG TPA: DinB family protein [Flavobacteriaceae bacterium]|nr:DinB family protein [Flavobacteriaceae bacterium]HBR54333.1 DinB family protein [Flavobacteriaceae bacterium]|tara:strand:- start:448 stop:960 length:513 start_codon:yes stop_codon:yes gene_type:complete